MGVLDGRIAIVTGAGQGIGKGIALALAAEGAAVVVAEQNEDLARACSDEIAQRGNTALAVPCDVRNRDQVEFCVAETVEHFGSLHILVNNAMAAKAAPLELATEDDLKLALETGPMGTLSFMRASFPHLEGDGRIINLRSGSELQGLAGFGTYVAAKSAIAGLTKVAAREWGPRGITVNAICPFASTPSMEAFFSDPAVLDLVLGTLSIKRVGDAEKDIGRAVVFLAGPDATYVNGCTLMVDGGGSFL